MEAWYLYILLIFIPFLAKRFYDHIIKSESDNSNAKVTHLAKPSPPDFILTAIKAFVVSGKNADEVKKILRGLNIDDEKTEFVVEIAQKVYINWLNENKKDGKVKSDEIKDLKDTLQVTNDMPIPPITRHSKQREQYTDPFRTLMGKETYRDKSTQKLIDLMASYISFLQPVKSNKQVQICQASFNGFGGRYNGVQLRVIKLNDKRESYFPYLISTIAQIPFITSEVLEWESKSGFKLEAEVKGMRNGKTELSFFATDYAVNKGRYLREREINVRISAFAYHIYEFKTHNDTSLKDVVFLKKNDLSNAGKHSFYNFTGTILKVDGVSILPDIRCYVLRIKLFENGDNMIESAIDVFVNAENFTSGQFRKNKVVKGTLWLQGELAD